MRVCASNKSRMINKNESNACEFCSMTCGLIGNFAHHLAKCLQPMSRHSLQPVTNASLALPRLYIPYYNPVKQSKSTM